MFLRAVSVKSGGFTSKMVSFNSWLYNHIFASQGKLGSPSPSLPITTALQALFWHEASLQSHLNPWKFSSWFQWELDQTLLGQELPKALSYIPPMLPFPWYLQAKSKMFIKVELHGQKTEEQMARQAWCVTNTNDKVSVGCGHQLWSLGRKAAAVSLVQRPQGTTG